MSIIRVMPRDAETAFALGTRYGIMDSDSKPVHYDHIFEELQPHFDRGFEYGKWYYEAENDWEA